MDGDEMTRVIWRMIKDKVTALEGKVGEGDNNGLEVDKASKLVELGCSSGQVAHAMEICGKSTGIEEIFDFIQATSFEKEVDSLKHEEHIELKLFQELEKMGFSFSAIKNTMETCESLDLQSLVNFLLKARKDELPHGKDLQQVEKSNPKFCAYVESLENEENIEFIPFQELTEMGFSSFAIKNAMETCESLNLEDLLSFLLEAEKDKFPNEEDLKVKETGQESHTYEKCTKFGFKVNNGAGPSKALITPAKWTREKIKLWYTYLGLNQDFFTVSYSGKRMYAWKVKQGKKEKLSGFFVPEKMMGFSIPGFLKGRPRALPGIMVGPSYFYFENVACAPKFEWETIKRHLHGVDVEFVDSKFFSACRRPRGYVHNIPIATRRLLIPEPHMRIFDTFPSTQKYWPHWDTREKLNCINTRRAPDTLSEMIQSFFIEYEGSEIPFARQQEILIACKRWNLMWVGPGQAAPLEPHEMELLLGFDKDHTRGCSSFTARYTALGNAFQVNTVAYHLSPLKQLYPEGITVLSLFSGIGGAEVALHKCGITLKAVVAVENDARTRNIIASWWKKSGQTGVLRPMDDVKNLTYEVLSGLIDEIGKIDLIIGGSPCSNLSGCNRVSRNGLGGKESSLFFEFSRILDLVKQIMSNKGYI